jgi:membrane protease YdiL (CAAX protease family)
MKKGGNMEKNRNLPIYAAVLCFLPPLAAMALVDSVLLPPYGAKSAIKAALFALWPLACAKLFRLPYLGGALSPKRFPAKAAALLSAGVFAAILLAYAVFSSFLDFSKIVPSLGAKYQIGRGNYIFAACYLTLANSFLEEAYFRGFCFHILLRSAGRAAAYALSSAAFAFYHAAVIVGWLPPAPTALMFAGLFAGGLVFSRLNEAFGSVYPSWAVHAASDLAISAIGFQLFYG